MMIDVNIVSTKESQEELFKLALKVFFQSLNPDLRNVDNEDRLRVCIKS